MRSPTLHPRLRLLCQLLFLLLLLIAACTDLGSCTARRGLQLLLLLRPAALPLLLIRSPALHPRLQLLGQLLFLPLLLLMLLLLSAARWSLTACR
jgi:hypothetical protein